MRLQEIYFICKKATDAWQPLAFEDINSAGVPYYKVRNPDNIRCILSCLAPIKCFSKTIGHIQQKSIGFSQSFGDIIVDQQQRTRVRVLYDELRFQVTTIKDLFESLDYKQESDGFDIKLPPNMSLSDLSKCAKDLDIVFSTCPLFRDGQAGDISFSAVDVGSIWLSFVIHSGAIAITLKLFAELIDRALIIRSHYLTAKEQEEKVQSLHLGNELLESTISINKAIGKGLMDRVCAELSEEHDVREPEDVERLKNSIQLLSDWMSKGMEICPSVLASSETKAVFPSLEQQALPLKRTELITDGGISKE